MQELCREIDAIRQGSPSLISIDTTSIATASTSTLHGLNVPKPTMSSGVHNVIAVENFLFGLEKYLKTMGIVEEITKISNVAIFFKEVDQLWWRRKHTERVKGLCMIDT